MIFLTKLWGIASGISLKFWGYLAAFFAVLAALAKIYSAGKTAAKVDSEEKVLHDVETRNEVEDRVSGADDTERERLRNKWTKP